MRHAHLREDLAPFGNAGDALGDDAVRRQAQQRRAIEGDLTAIGRCEAENRADQRALARAIGAENARDTAFFQLQGQVMDDVDAVIGRGNALNAQ
ncbi:hypothetical protein D3C76_1737470 [compost metagenome]